MPITVAVAVHHHDGHPAHPDHQPDTVLRGGRRPVPEAGPLALRPGVSPLWWSVPRRLAFAAALVAALWLVIAWAVL